MIVSHLSPNSRSVAPGDPLCADPDLGGLTLATPATFAWAEGLAGIALEAAEPGGPIRYLAEGPSPTDVLDLGAGPPSLVVVQVNARVVRGAFGPVIGFCDAEGRVTIQIPRGWSRGDAHPTRPGPDPSPASSEGSTTTPAPPLTPWPALILSGIDSGLALVADPDLEPVGDATWELWLRPDAYSGADGAPTPVWDCGGAGAILLEKDGRLRFRCEGTRDGAAAEASASTGPLPLGEWSHVALIRDIATSRLCWVVNGHPQEATPLALDSITATGKTVSIGAATGYAWRLRGALAELRLWGHARSAAEVNAWRKRRIPADVPGLVGCWPLDEAVGDRASELRAHRVTGRLAGHAWTQTPPSLGLHVLDSAPAATPTRNCIATSRQDDPCVEIPDHEALRITGDCTVEIWVRIDAHGRDWILSKPGIFRLGMLETGVLQAGFSGGVTQSQAPLPLGRWIHLAFSRGVGPDPRLNRSMHVYVNGERWIWDYPEQLVAVDQGGALRLGTSDPGPYAGGPFMGAMAELRVWSEMRTPEQIREAFARRLRPEEAARTVGYWPLDDGGDTLRDLGPHRLDGRRLGGRWEPVAERDLGPAPTGPVAPAIRLGGPATTLELADAPAVLGADGSAIELWIRPRGLIQYIPVELLTQGDLEIELLQRRALVIRDRVTKAAVSCPGLRLDEGRWSHLALVRAHGKLELWIDGARVCSPVDWTLPDRAVSAPILLGADHENPLDADLCELRVWGCARSGEEIRRDRGRVLPQVPGLIRRWALDLATGAAILVTDGPTCLARGGPPLPAPPTGPDLQPVGHTPTPLPTTEGPLRVLSTPPITPGQHQLYHGPALRLYLDRDIYEAQDTTAHGVGYFLTPHPRDADRVELRLLDELGTLHAERLVRLTLERRQDWPAVEFLIATDQLASGSYTLHARAVDDLEQEIGVVRTSFEKVARRAPDLPIPEPGIPLRWKASDATSTGLWPVSTAVPLPIGLIHSPEELVLLEDGKPVPAQWTSYSRWSVAGSLRWVGLDLLARWRDGRPCAYHVVRASGHRPPDTGLKVIETDQQITVDTGVARFQFHRGGFSGIHAASLAAGGPDRISGAGGPYVVDETDRVYASCWDSEGTVAVEDQGPVRVTVVARGWYTSQDGEDRFCRYVTRVSMHSGQATAVINHRTIVTYDTRSARRVRDAGWQLDVSVGASPRWRATVDDAVRQGSVGRGFYAHQHRADQARLVSGETSLSVGRLDGVLTVEDSQGAVSVALRDTWQRYPKELEIDPESNGPLPITAGQVRLNVHFWPRHGLDTFADDEIDDRQHVAKLRFAHHGRDLVLQYPDRTLDRMATWPDWLPAGALDGPRKGSAQGVAFGGTFRVVMHAGSPSDADLLTLARLHQADPHAIPDPAWTAATGVEERFAPADPSRSPTVERFLRRSAPAYARYAVDRAGEYGMWVYGAWHDNWDVEHDRPVLNRLFANSHYRNVYATWMLYLRSGDASALELARAVGEQFMDTGTLHHAREGAGGGPAGSVMHAYGLAPWLDEHAPGGHWLDVHAWMLQAIVTGDRRGLDVAGQWAENLRGSPPNTPTRYATRQDAGTNDWIRNHVTNLGELVRYYQITLDPLALFSMRDNALGIMDIPFEWVAHYYHHPVFHDTWMLRYHAQTRDPRTVVRFERWLADGNRHLGAATLLYWTTGERRWLEALAPKLHAAMLQIHDAPGTAYDGYSSLSSAVAFQNVLQALYALPAIEAAGLDAERLPPTVFFEHPVSAYVPSFFSNAGPTGWSHATLILLVLVGSERGFRIRPSSVRGLGYTAGGLLRVYPAPTRPAVEHWRGDTPTPLLSRDLVEGEGVDVGGLDPGLYRVEIVGSAPLEHPIVVGLGNERAPLYAQVLVTRRDAGPTVLQAMSTLDLHLRPLKADDRVQLRITALEDRRWLPTWVRVDDALGNTLVETTLLRASDRPVVEIALDPERHPLPWHLRTSGWESPRLLPLAGPPELLAAPDPAALAPIVAALAAEGEPPRALRGGLWLEPNAAGLRWRGSQSFECWLYPESIQQAQTLYHRHPNEEGWFHVAAGGQIVAQCGGGQGEPIELRPAGGVLKTDRWTHLAVVIDRERGVLAVYLDGALLGSQAMAPGPTAGLSPIFDGLFLGRRKNGDAFQGLLCDARVWQVVRTEAEIQRTLAQRLRGDEPGLAAYWRLDEGYGTTARDASGHGVEGSCPVTSWATPPKRLDLATPPSTTTTTTTPVPTRRWPCLGFPGGAFVDFGVPDALKLTGDLTVELWVRLDALPLGTQRAALYARGTTTAGVLWVESTGRLLFQGGFKSGSSTLTRRLASTSALPTGTWNHVALVRDINLHRLRWIINGMVDAESTLEGEISAAVAGAASPTWLGQSSAGKDLLQGALCDVRVWGLARSAPDVAAAMRTRLAGTEPGLVATWRLDEGTGASVHDGGPSGITGMASGTTWGDVDEAAGLR